MSSSFPPSKQCHPGDCSVIQAPCFRFLCSTALTHQVSSTFWVFPLLWAGSFWRCLYVLSAISRTSFPGSLYLTLLRYWVWRQLCKIGLLTSWLTYTLTHVVFSIPQLFLRIVLLTFLFHLGWWAIVWRDSDLGSCRFSSGALKPSMVFKHESLLTDASMWGSYSLLYILCSSLCLCYIQAVCLFKLSIPRLLSLCGIAVLPLPFYWEGDLNPFYWNTKHD